jgi:carboxyl-terminal processing protease
MASKNSSSLGARGSGKPTGGKASDLKKSGKGIQPLIKKSSPVIKGIVTRSKTGLTANLDSFPTSKPKTSRTARTRTIRTRVTSNVDSSISAPGVLTKETESNSALSPINGGYVKTKKISDDAISRAFLFVFVAALSFVIGTGVGNQRNQPLVDSAIDKLIESAPEEMDRATLERAAIEGALKASGDEWANYFPQSTLDQLNNVASNYLTGVGVSISEARSGAIRVSDVQDGSVADRNGVQIGDQILRVNGVDVQGGSATAVAALIRGEIGKKVDLAIRRDAELIEVSLLTERVDLRTVDASQIDSNIGFISISNFAIGTAAEVQKALSDIRSEKGVVIDLRDNPGGIIEEAVRVAELFIGRGVIVSYKVNGDERIFSANNSKPNPAPVVILINKRTTSAAELLAAAFQDRNRGVVIGEKSYGKGSVQEFVTLRDGSKLELTVALYLTPSGRTIEGEGVTPDLAVPEGDLAIKALQILGGLAELATQQSK